MSQLRQRMVEEMQLRRFAQTTQEAYVHWVSELAKYYHKSPDQVSREEVRSWFVYLTNERKLSRSSVTVALCALRFFYASVLHQDWQEFQLVRPLREKKLPVVLSVEEVQRLLRCVEMPRYRVCLSVLYSCGLRLLEGTQLRVAQIDTGARWARMLLHIQVGKGNKDRYVPLFLTRLLLIGRLSLVSLCYSISLVRASIAHFFRACFFAPALLYFSCLLFFDFYSLALNTLLLNSHISPLLGCVQHKISGGSTFEVTSFVCSFAAAYFLFRSTAQPVATLNSMMVYLVIHDVHSTLTTARC